MPYKQLLSANPDEKDWAGSCLSFSSHAFSVPDFYGSAWDGWVNSIQHADRDFPDGVAVPVWFEHFGTYGDPPTYKNWGHVVVRMTDGRFMSSPGSGFGQAWFTTVEQVEQYFRCRFVGWSEDINRSKVVEASPVVTRSKSMSTLYVTQRPDGSYLWALAGDGVGSAGWLETTGLGLANEWAAAHGTNVLLNAETFANFKSRYLGSGTVPGSVTVTIDYELLAKTFLDMQAKRLSS